MNPQARAFIIAAQKFLHSFYKEEKECETLREFLDSPEGIAGMFLQNASRFTLVLFDLSNTKTGGVKRFITEGMGFVVLNIEHSGPDPEITRELISVEDLVLEAAVLGKNEKQLIDTLRKGFLLILQTAEDLRENNNS